MKQLQIKTQQILYPKIKRSSNNIIPHCKANNVEKIWFYKRISARIYEHAQNPQHNMK